MQRFPRFHYPQVFSNFITLSSSFKVTKNYNTKMYQNSTFAKMVIEELYDLASNWVFDYETEHW